LKSNTPETCVGALETSFGFSGDRGYERRRAYLNVEGAELITDGTSVGIKDA
jgi:hypothetical protein